MAYISERYRAFANKRNLQLIRSTIAALERVQTAEKQLSDLDRILFDDKVELNMWERYGFGRGYNQHGGRSGGRVKNRAGGKADSRVKSGAGGKAPSQATEEVRSMLRLELSKQNDDDAGVRDDDSTRAVDGGSDVQSTASVSGRDKDDDEGSLKDHGGALPNLEGDARAKVDYAGVKDNETCAKDDDTKAKGDDTHAEDDKTHASEDGDAQSENDTTHASDDGGSQPDKEHIQIKEVATRPTDNNILSNDHNPTEKNDDETGSNSGDIQASDKGETDANDDHDAQTTTVNAGHAAIIDAVQSAQPLDSKDPPHDIDALALIDDHELHSDFADDLLIDHDGLPPYENDYQPLYGDDDLQSDTTLQSNDKLQSDVNLQSDDNDNFPKWDDYFPPEEYGYPEEYDQRRPLGREREREMLDKWGELRDITAELIRKRAEAVRAEYALICMYVNAQWIDV